MRRWGFYRVAGCDEVGRGCLAGPVVAAAVILDPDRQIPGVCDSKMATPTERERLYGVITGKALAWSVASVPVWEIDDINIHQASLRAMRRALLAIAPLPDLVLVDAFGFPNCRSRSVRCRTETGGAAGSRRRRSLQRSRATGRCWTTTPRIPVTATIVTRAMPRRVTWPPSCAMATSSLHRRSVQAAIAV